jgi:signal transduction histidine kinase
VVFFAAREAMRNAARYGRGDDRSRPLHLCVSVTCDGNTAIVIEDDGVGLRDDGMPNGGGGQGLTSGQGFTSGQGLALHSTMMAVIGGALAVESQPGAYTRVVLTLPLHKPAAS